MHSSDSSRVQFEEAVAVGAVFSPVLLTALPFLSPAIASIAVVALLAFLLALTLIGYLTYRKQVGASNSFHTWRISLLVLLAVAFLMTVVALAFELGGFIAGSSAVSLFLLFAATAWKKTPRSRAHEYTSNQAIVGAAAGLGAVSAGVLSLAFGSTFVHAVVVTLHFSLGIIATILLIRASQEARASQNAA